MKDWDNSEYILDAEADEAAERANTSYAPPGWFGLLLISSFGFWVAVGYCLAELMRR